MDQFNKVFNGQLIPSEIKTSNNSFDLTVVWLVHHNFKDAQVQLNRFGVYSYTRTPMHEFLKGLLWAERQSTHTKFCMSGDGYNGIDRVFSSESTARKFMLYVGLNGFAIENKVVKPIRKPLQRITIAPKEPQDDQDN